MAITVSMLKADAARVFVDFPTESATISGQTFDVLVMENQSGSEWGEGGETLNKTVKLALKRDQVATMPADGDSATFRSTVYRVANVEEDDLGSNVIVDIVLPEQ